MTPAQRLIISNFATGYEKDREAFLINNDAFPLIQNMYEWRGKMLKRRGTFLLGRLERYIPNNGTRPHTGSSSTVIGILDGSGNLAATSLISVFSLQSGSNIAPGSISFSDGTNTYTDNSAGVLTGTPGGSGTINYATSSITITGGAAAGNLVGSFQYYPNLPVMGARSFSVSSAQEPTTVFFDTVYAYQFDQSTSVFYDVSFYKNPTSTPKTSMTPVIWSGQNYQQFWTNNYQGAMWATNNKPGFHFVNGAYNAGTGTTTITFDFSKGGAFTSLVVGDRLWFNEWNTGGSTLNGLTGIVTTVSGTPGRYVVTFTSSPTAAGTGIAELLTNSISGQDGIRWYDGDPTSSTAAGSGLGWVNFSPPLSNVASPEYLVGALAVVPFKDRLLFFGPYTQTSASSSPTLYQDRIIYSQNGTPYYTTLVPSGQGVPSNSNAWIQNVVGYGGFIAGGVQQPIVSVANNEDVLLVDFTNRKTKLVYTSNDLIPFLFYNINSELGTESTFSTISLDAGALSVGQYGFALTTQNSVQRIDLLIPDAVFEIKQTNFGVNRVCAIRDFRNEFVYFTYPSNQNRASENFPTQTLVFNYRENTWALFIENYTSYGTFRYTSDRTWANLPYSSWSAWTDPWNSGKGDTNYPFVCGGNQQGFVLIKDDKGITEAQSQYIQGITISGTTVTINSPNHCLQAGDYIYILGCIGVSDINATIRQINSIVDENSFRIDTVSPNSVPSGTYIGAGTYARLPVPVVLSKQFPIFWEQGKRIRIGTQRYLLDETSDGEITVGLFLNQNSAFTTNNFGANQPSPFNSSVIFTQTVLTSPAPVPNVVPNQSIGNLGNGVSTTFTFNIFTLCNLSGTLVPSTIVISIGNPGASTFTDDGSGGFNVTGLGVSSGSSVDYTTGAITLVVSSGISASATRASFYYYPIEQYSASQAQIWHRNSTSLLGDTIQIGLTLSDAQMRDYAINNSEIVLHAISIDVYPSGVLAL